MRWSKPDVESFVARFEGFRVSKQEWTHQAHLVTGFWYVHSLGLDVALEKMREGIRRHNEAVGTPNSDTGGYHETITRLFLGDMDRQMRLAPSLDFEESLARVLESPLSSSAWPLTLYTKERLFSVDARRAWVEPDAVPGAAAGAKS